jgi:2-aminoadipate transaminase
MFEIENVCGDALNMIEEPSRFFSKNVMNIERSAIRELLKITRQPEIISFGGGLPAPDTFPVEELEEITCQLLREKGAVALQYGPTEGEIALREEIAKWMMREKATVKSENVLVTSGSQQGLDIIAKIFLDPNDSIIVELPSYMGGLQAFSAYRAKMLGVPQDNDGMRMDLLEKVLAKLARKGRKPKFIYVVPDFQNPSGVTMTLERRKYLLELARKYEVPVIEDSPYRDLRFVGDSVPMIFSLDKENYVVALGTFSKLLCPGLRLAWITAPVEWIEPMVVAKQSMDLSSPIFTQLMVAEYLKRGLLPKQVEKIRRLYARKRDVMINALRRYMPKGVEWTEPEGGLFLWVKLPKRMDTTELFPKAVENKVAYVMGSAFHCDGKGRNTMRLNFSYPSEEQIEEGIKRLAKMVRENM